MTYQAILIRRPSGEKINIKGKNFIQPCASNPLIGLHFTKSGDEWILTNKNISNEFSNIKVNKNKVEKNILLHNKDKITILDESFEFLRHLKTSRVKSTVTQDPKENKEYNYDKKEIENKKKNTNNFENTIVKIIKSLECTVCVELFTDPVILSCNHTFCLRCITDWKKKSNFCPLCRSKISSVKDFYSVLALHAMVEMVKEEVPESLLSLI